MCRSPCCSKQRVNRGAWTKTEDMTLSNYIRIHGYGRWRDLPQKAGLSRCGKSCRFRWMKYLRPDIKVGNISPDEEELIIRMHRLLGNRWSLIAGRLPGRTDNEIKHYWNTHLRKKILREECQNNLKTTAESRPLRNVVFKTTPVKITTPVRYNGMLAQNRCCSNIGNSDLASKKFNIQETTNSPFPKNSDPEDDCYNIGNSDRPSKKFNIQETTNSSEQCCDPFLKNSDTEDDSEHAPFRMSDTNLVETEADLHSSHSIDDILFDLNQFLFSTGFGLEDFHSGPATSDAGMTAFEYQSNMQQENSFTVTDDPRIKEIYDSTEPVDWKRLLSHVLN